MLGARNKVSSRSAASWPARTCSISGENRAVALAVAGQHQRAVGVPQAEVDVAGVALALVELGHEGQAMPSWAAISLAPFL